MFRDRDIILLAIGAIAGIATLVLPFSLIIRAIIATVVLGVFMLLALARFGPDRVPLEQFLLRWWRYTRTTQRRYVYQRAAPPEPPPSQPSPPSPTPTTQSKPQPPIARPVVFTFEDVGIEPVLTAALTILAAYLAYWLYHGGAQDVGNAIHLLVR